VRGDALFAVFPRAADALAAALEAQLALAGTSGPRGSPSASGWACTQATRRSSAAGTTASTSTAPRGSPRGAHGWQVLVSEVAAELAWGALPARAGAKGAVGSAG
jgi:hypothetical protein